MNQTTNEDLIAAKIRDTNASAALKERKLAILQGEYIKASDVEKHNADAVNRVKTKLLALPSKLTPQLSGQALEAENVNQILTLAVNEALNELASAERHEL